MQLRPLCSQEHGVTSLEPWHHESNVDTGQRFTWAAVSSVLPPLKIHTKQCHSTPIFGSSEVPCMYPASAGLSVVTGDSCLFLLERQDSVWSTAYRNMKFNTLNNCPDKRGWRWWPSIFSGSSTKNFTEEEVCLPAKCISVQLSAPTLLREAPLCSIQHNKSYFFATVSQKAVFEFLSFWFRARYKSDSSIWFSPRLIVVVAIFSVTNSFYCSGQVVLLLELMQVLIIYPKNLDRLSTFSTFACW